MVCIVGLAGADLFLNPPANEASRKRLIQLMAKFVLDKNAKTRYLKSQEFFPLLLIHIDAMY